MTATGTRTGSEAVTTLTAGPADQASACDRISSVAIVVTPNELVTVSGTGAPVDGIVFDTPSKTKVVVAVMQAGRGPVFRTVSPKALTPRTEAGEDDSALRLLLRRTPVPVRGASRGATAGGQGRSGFARGTAHRPTGR